MTYFFYITFGPEYLYAKAWGETVEDALYQVLRNQSIKNISAIDRILYVALVDMQEYKNLDTKNDLLKTLFEISQRVEP